MSPTKKSLVSHYWRLKTFTNGNTSSVKNSQKQSNCWRAICKRCICGWLKPIKVKKKLWIPEETVLDSGKNGEEPGNPIRTWGPHPDMVKLLVPYVIPHIFRDSNMGSHSMGPAYQNKEGPMSLGFPLIHIGSFRPSAMVSLIQTWDLDRDDRDIWQTFHKLWQTSTLLKTNISPENDGWKRYFLLK